MKGLKIIPLFLLLIVLSYFGVLFVEDNRTEVIISFFGTTTPPMAMGFVVLTSALAGMIVAGFLCILELVVLYLQNKSMRRKLKSLGHETTPSIVESLEDESVQNNAIVSTESTPDAEEAKPEPAPEPKEKEKTSKKRSKSSSH